MVSEEIVCKRPPDLLLTTTLFVIKVSASCCVQHRISQDAVKPSLMKQQQYFTWAHVKLQSLGFSKAFVSLSLLLSLSCRALYPQTNWSFHACFQAIILHNVDIHCCRRHWNSYPRVFLRIWSVETRLCFVIISVHVCFCGKKVECLYSMVVSVFPEFLVSWILDSGKYKRLKEMSLSLLSILMSTEKTLNI